MSGPLEHGLVDSDPPRPSQDALGSLDLSRSTVRSVMASPSSLVVLLEACLEPEHPRGHVPGIDGLASIAPAAMMFSGVSELSWQHAPTGTTDDDGPDRVVVDGRRCRLDLGDDAMDLSAKDVRLVLDGNDDRPQRREATPRRQPGASEPEGLQAARLQAAARRRATAMVMDRVGADPAARPFWRSAVEAALEAVDTRPLDPPLVGWPFAEDHGQLDHSTLDAFADVHLAESHLLTVVALPGTVIFLLDAAILTSSPYWRQPPPGEWATWLPATLRFLGVTELRWSDAHQAPSFDANLEKDFGNIDSLTYRDDTYRIDTGAGVLEITAVTIDLDVHPGGRSG